MLSRSFACIRPKVENGRLDARAIRAQAHSPRPRASHGAVIARPCHYNQSRLDSIWLRLHQSPSAISSARHRFYRRIILQRDVGERECLKIGHHDEWSFPTCPDRAAPIIIETLWPESMVLSPGNPSKRVCHAERIRSNCVHFYHVFAC